jgi:Peptidase family S41
MAGRAKKILFAPPTTEAESALAKSGANEAADEVTSRRPEMSARVVETSHGRFGYVRIWTFAPADRNEPFEKFLSGFVGEFARLIEALPQEGLIVDVRSNGGGIIYAGEMLLQLLTPHHIEPERLQFINTPLNMELCRLNGPRSGIDLSPWVPSMSESVQTGAIYSRAFPITTEDMANSIGQRYYGPVVLVTDARCYSTTDIFAAGFQDHEIGTVVGVDMNTGAGGANVWTHELLRQLMQASPSSPYARLPGEAQMRVAIRQTVRVGKRAGTLLEDLGVVPDSHHPMTRADLLEGNRDLIERAASILAGMPMRQLKVELVSGLGGTPVVRAATRGLTRLDVYADDRPQGSADIVDGTNELELRIAGAKELRFEGFQEGQLVASRRLAMP